MCVYFVPRCVHYFGTDGCRAFRSWAISRPKGAATATTTKTPKEHHRTKVEILMINIYTFWRPVFVYSEMEILIINIFSFH